MKSLSREEAQAILDSLEIDLSNEEETELLKEHNPVLLDAYRRLIEIAKP